MINMPQPSYAYAAAHAFALENKLLSHDRLERMVDAPSAADAYKILVETEYGNGISEIPDFHDYEKLLSEETRKLHELIKSISPTPRITDLFFIKYDFHNLKVLLKARYLNRDQDQLLMEVGTLPIEILKEAVEEREYDSLPSIIGNTVKELDEMMDLKVDPRNIDLALDRAMYEYIFQECRRCKNTFVMDYFTKQVDLINIRSFIRVRKMDETFGFLKEVLLPHGRLDYGFFEQIMQVPLEALADQFAHTEYAGLVREGVEDFIKTGALTVYERLMDDFLLDYVKSVRWNPTGLEPVIGYLLAKENEIRLIRIVMVGKINNLPAEKIRERLRDVYV